MDGKVIAKGKGSKGIPCMTNKWIVLHTELMFIELMVARLDANEDEQELY